MGLKYIETVKSIILLLLVALSIILTFSIWTYTPRYETNEQLTTVDISIAKRMPIEEIIKPYKLVFNFGGDMTGTFAPTDIDYVVDELKKWKLSEVSLVDNNFNAEKLDVLMRKSNRFTLYFHGEVPLSVYDDVLNIGDSKMEVPEASFDRLIVDWNPAGTAMDIHFVSRTTEVLFSAKVEVDNYQHFYRSILTWGRDLGEYVDVNPERSPFIAVATEPVETIRNTYYQEEIAPTRFRDALFADPNAVRRSQVGSNQEEFQDDHALMNIDTEKKTLKYVLPATESQEVAIPSELLLNTIDFVNEHGGWTDEFRYTYMNPMSRYVKFQLFLHGLPVYSDTASTEITQMWGDNRIYRYIRPYYTLNVTLPSETEVKLLSSGVEVAKMLEKSGSFDVNTVEEIAPGYFMTHDIERRLFIMEPSWFYSIKGSWIRFSPEELGGEMIGLE